MAHLEAPKRVLILGDVHGNANFVQYAAKMAQTNNCDGIVQLGDWGYWTHRMNGVRFLNDVERILKDFGLFIIFLDGNHENFDLLWRWEDHELTEDGFWKVWASDRLLYSPRGHRWTWGNTTMLTLGGAPSIDKDIRISEETHSGPRTMWWPEECIRENDIFACGDDPVDIMFTHDVPYGVNVPGIRWIIPDMWPEAFWNRKAVEFVMRRLQPKHLFHGHYHISYNDYYQDLKSDYECQVVGLAHDGKMKDAYVVLNIT